MVSSKAATVGEYLEALPPERRATLANVRKLIRKHLPKGFKEAMQYGMISYHVPPSRLPDTYNGQPLAIISLAAQKSYFSLYLMGMSGSADRERRLAQAFRKAGKKLDMGKSCLRFKSLDDLALDGIAELIASTTVEDFIRHYQRSRAEAGAVPTRAASPRRSKSG